MAVRPQSKHAHDAPAVRLSAAERAEMATTAERQGFPSLTAYLRHLHACAERKCPAKEPPAFPPDGVRVFHSTALGTMLCGDALCHLHNTPLESVDLVMTSPPFGLVRKKSYGNEDAHRYCDWFRPFALGFQRVLKKTGSFGDRHRRRLETRHANALALPLRAAVDAVRGIQLSISARNTIGGTRPSCRPRPNG